MDDKQAKRVVGGPAIVATIVVVFVLLPLVYLLAIGPIVWLHRRGFVSVEPGSVIERVYYPAELAAQHCTPFARSIEMYVSLWEPVETPKIAPVYAPLPAPPTAAAATPAVTPSASAAATESAAPAGS